MSGYGRQIIVTSAVAAVLIIGIGLGLYYASPALEGTSSITNTNALQGGGDQTIVATYVSTFTGISSSTTSTNPESSSTTTTQVSSSTASSSTTPSGVFSYSPNSQVKILSVQAYTSQSESGNQSVTFNVEFQNIGSSTIYVVSGGSSSLSATIISGPVHTQLNNVAKCEIVSAEIPVGSGQNFTSVTPGCWSGYNYQLSQPGKIQVELTLTWATGISNSGVSNMIEIMAEFTLN